MGKLALGGSSRGISPRRGAADDNLAADAQRGDDARPVEDGVPGGNRFGVGADRLPPVQRVLRPGAVRRTADQLTWRPEPKRLPTAGRVRLCGDAVQLHRDWWEPADRAGADGQHRDLEARVKRDVERVLRAAL